jgi:hypothetical protein
MAATISYLSDAQQDDALVGLTVKQAKEQWQALWKIPTNTTYMVNGKPVDENYVLKDGDKLEIQADIKKG